MKTETFKAMLRDNKKCLKGKELKIYLGASDWEETFTTLESFGNRILELEAKGYTFSFEDSLTKVRASFKSSHTFSLRELTADIKRFGTAA